MKNPETGLIVDVLKSPAMPDCTNGGLSSRFNEFVFLGTDGPFAPGPDRPALKIVKRRIFGETYVHAEPVDAPPVDHIGWMAGGHFVHTSDSRFREAVGHSYPISLHDRSETVEQYRALSI